MNVMTNILTIKIDFWVYNFNVYNIFFSFSPCSRKHTGKIRTLEGKEKI